MIKLIKRMALLIGLLFLLSFSSYVGLLLNPGILYAKSTQIEHYWVYYQGDLCDSFSEIVVQSHQIVQGAEIYDADFQVDICLNSDPLYPRLVEAFNGKAFGHGFANKAVIAAPVYCDENFALLNERRYNLTELLAHEILHTHQYNTYGFSTLDFPFWKLEGYPEYVIYGPQGDSILRADIDQYIRFIEEKGADPWNWMEAEDGTGKASIYFKSRLLFSYLMEIQGMNYQQILADNRGEQALWNEMIGWSKSPN